MKLELGKRYRTRNGRETSPLKNNDSPLYHFKASLDGGLTNHYWTKKGAWLGEGGEFNLDLVEEIKESEGVKKPDAVKPEHYRANGSDVIKFCQDNNLDFLQGNVVKYITRYKKKNGKEDLLKAKEYINRMIGYEK